MYKNEASLRRTLLLKNLLSTVDRRLSTVIPNVQVSDTTGDDSSNAANTKKLIGALYKKAATSLVIAAFLPQ